MRTVVAITVAYLCLIAVNVFAQPLAPTRVSGVSPHAQSEYLCVEIAANSRNHEIRLKLRSFGAELVNYWGDARSDQGELKASKSTGDRVYKGFPHWVADGVEGSGFLFVSKQLLESGAGKAALLSRFCQASCSTRKAELKCKSKKIAKGNG
jgi:hypothetical protein